MGTLCCLTRFGCEVGVIAILTGLGTANFGSLLDVLTEAIDCGVLGPWPEMDELQDAGVGGLKELGVEGFEIDMGEAMAVSTDFIRLGGGPPDAQAFGSLSSCLTSCFTDTGYQDAFESIVTSSRSVLQREQKVICNTNIIHKYVPLTLTIKVAQHEKIYILFKDAPSGLRQFLATESPLKVMKNACYFTITSQDI